MIIKKILILFAYKKLMKKDIFNSIMFLKVNTILFFSQLKHKNKFKYFLRILIK